MKKHLQKLLLLAMLLAVPWVTQGQTFSYTCNFDNDSDTAGWVLLNSGQTNQWFIGTATHNGGTKSLYISNDNGSSNTYSTGTTVFAYAYQEFTLDSGGYAISYDWKCYGESNYDYIRVFLAPASATLTPGLDPTGGNSAYSWSSAALPTGFISLTGSTAKLNLQSTWQNFFAEFYIPTSGSWKLVFAWANDASGGTAPPAAIDNIAFIQPTCPRPSSMQFFNITPTSFDLSWVETGTALSWLVYLESGSTVIDSAIVFDTTHTFSGLTPNTPYTVRVAAMCDITDTSMWLTSDTRTPCVAMDTLPFFHDFEGDATGTSTTGSAFPFCWTRLNNGTSSGGYPYVSNSTTYNHTPGGSKGLYWYNTTTTGSYGDYQCVVLPNVDTDIYPIRTLQLRFWARSSSTSYYPIFKVGVLTNPNDINTFTEVATVNVGNSTVWQEYEVPLGTYTGTGTYVALNSPRATSSWYCYVDDFTLEIAPSCPRINELRATATAAHAYVEWEYSTALGIDPIDFELAYRPTADTFGTPTTVTVTGLNYTISGLDAGTSYTITVTPNCGSDNLGEPKTATFSTRSLACLEWDTTASGPVETITVGTDGTGTTYYMPINEEQNYSYFQSLIRTTDIDLNGPATISAVGFQYASTLQMTQITNCSIYMAHTTQENMSSSFVPYEDLQLVYVGPMNCTAPGWVFFQFNQGSFHYDGVQNMVIGVVNNSGAHETTSHTFNYHVPGVTLSRRTQGSSPYSASNMTASSGSGSTWRCNMRLLTGSGDCISVVSCSEPSITIDSVRQTEAYLSWIPGFEENAWDVDYRATTDTAWTNAAMSITTPYIAISGLLPNTPYEVRVSPNCTDSVMYATKSFRTECGATPVPFYEHFDTWSSTAADPLPDCWAKRTNYSTNYPYASTSYNHTPGGSKAMYMYSTSSTWSYMVLPLFAPPIDSLQLSFWLYKSNTSYAHRLFVGVMTDPEDETTFQSLDTIVPTSNWEEYTVMFNNYTDSGRYIAIMSPNGEYSYPYLDDLTVEYIPDCFPVFDLAATDITTDSATISWTDTTSISSWIVEYGPHNFVLGTGTIVNAFDTTITLSGLTPNTQYDVYVTPDCSSGVAGSDYITFRTYSFDLPLPLNCDFEDSTMNAIWVLENGSNTNAWAIGTATNRGGAKSLYISNNNGASNAYTISMSTLSIAYADVVISTPGAYGYSFDWKCYGESTLDYLRVALIPATVQLNAGTALPSGLNATSMPAGWISLDGNAKLNLNGSWQTRSDVIDIQNAGRYHLAFIFRCDGSVGTMPPPAVDNVMLAYAPCTRPDSIAISNLTQTTADFSWSEMGTSTEWQYQIDNGTITSVYTTDASITGLTANTSYTFRVRSICGAGDTSFWRVYNFSTPCNYISLPYSQDFELESTSSSTTGSAFVNCWTRLNNGTSYGGYPYVSSSSTYNHTPSGTKGLYWYNTTTTGTYGDYEVAVLPPVDTTIDISTLQLTFWAKASSSSSSPVFQVGVMTDPNNVSTFVGIDTVTFTGNTWTELTVPLAGYTGNGHFVAVKSDRASWTAYLDDFLLDYIPTCIAPRNITATENSTSSITVDWVDITPAIEWQIEYGPHGYTRGSAAGTSLTVTSHPVTLTSLDTLTSYDVYVRPICTVGDTARWYAPTTLSTAMCDNSNIFAIGSVSSTGTSYDYPVNNYWCYSLTETIIDSAEIGGPLDVEYIGYYYNYASPSTYKTNCTIYFQPTTKTVFLNDMDMVPLNPATAVKVYTGSLNCSQGWNFFRLDSVYHYNGEGNLLIIVDDNSGDYDGMDYAFKTQSCVGYKTIHYYSDDDNPSVTNPSSFTDNTGYEASRPVMQLVSCIDIPCRQPVISSVSHDYQSATITWIGDGNNYEVNIKETTASDWPDSNIAVTGNTYTFSGLSSATSYTFRVRQDCSADSLGYSDWATDSFITDSLPCLPPDSLHVTDVTNATATFDWITIGNENTWDIHVWTPGGIDSIYRVTSHPVTIGGFTAGLTYNAAVRALCGINLEEGDWSAAMTFATAICPNVANVSAGNVTDNSALIVWDLDDMAESWIVEYGYAGFDQGSGTIVPCTSNSFNATGLECETSYDFYVRAVCGTDWTSENWARVSFTTNECAEPCDAPFGVTATVNLNNVDVSWTPGEGNTAFEVEYGCRGFSHGSGTIVNATEPHTTLTGLEYNTQYDLYVRALCGADNYSAWSPVTTFTTGTEGIATADGVSCTIFPNPATSSTTITVGGVNGKVKIEVVDMNGRTVATETLECNSDCMKTMEVDKLAQGAYFVRISGEQVNMVRKLIVK